jgi:hypothetical protein
MQPLRFIQQTISSGHANRTVNLQAAAAHFHYFARTD